MIDVSNHVDVSLFKSSLVRLTVQIDASVYQSLVLSITLTACNVCESYHLISEFVISCFL